MRQAKPVITARVKDLIITARVKDLIITARVKDLITSDRACREMYSRNSVELFKETVHEQAAAMTSRVTHKMFQVQR